MERGNVTKLKLVQKIVLGAHVFTWTLNCRGKVGDDVADVVDDGEPQRSDFPDVGGFFVLEQEVEHVVVRRVVDEVGDGDLPKVSVFLERNVPRSPR